jgi:hypothetical protein
MAPGCSSASTGSRLLKIDPKAARTEYGPIYADHELAGSRRRRRGGRCRAEEIRPCACRRLSTQFHWFASSDRRQRNPVLAVGLGKNAVSFHIAVAPRLVSLALRVATTTTSRSAVAVIVCAVSEPLARYSAASRARSLCIRLKTFSEIWRGRSGAADSHIDGGAAEVAAFLVHLRADLDHEIGAIVAHDFRHVRVA